LIPPPRGRPGSGPGDTPPSPYNSGVRSTTPPAAGDGPRPGILLYGMYALNGQPNKAPTVRITLMTAALSHQIHTERITGGRFGRFASALRWLAGGGAGRVGAVYVESATTSAMPTDLLFLAWMRLRGKPVGVYFRDGYQLYRDAYPRTRRTQVLADWLWRLTTPILARVATHRFAPSAGLARALRLRGAVSLPPGTQPDDPDLGAGADPLVAYVGNYGWADGFETLLAAMAIVVRTCPEARLRVVGPAMSDAESAALAAYVEIRQAGRDGVTEALRDARVCVIPRPITAYTNLAMPIKLWDYLSLGKPVVSTATTETERVLVSSGAGVATPATPEGLAAGLLPILRDRALAERLAEAASRFARASGSTWDDRAKTVLDTLGLGVRP
jgi:glycosyltransferase involved in cell wall biosynthesis